MSGRERDDVSGYSLEHTDAMQQARFKALTPEEQMMEIWLNTRETNGHVAEALRDIHDLKDWRKNELAPWMETVNRKLIGAAAIIMAILGAAPIVFWVIGNLELR